MLPADDKDPRGVERTGRRRDCAYKTDGEASRVEVGDEGDEDAEDVDEVVVVDDSDAPRTPCAGRLDAMTGAAMVSVYE